MCYHVEDSGLNSKYFLGHSMFPPTGSFSALNDRIMFNLKITVNKLEVWRGALPQQLLFLVLGKVLVVSEVLGGVFFSWRDTFIFPSSFQPSYPCFSITPV